MWAGILSSRLVSTSAYASNRRGDWHVCCVLRNGMDYLVAYDIACPQRLRRVARVMERRAIRCQKSVFRFRGDRAGVNDLLDEAARAMDEEEDVIAAWLLAAAPTGPALVRGTPLPATPAAVVLAPGQRLFVKQIED
jgi:CRISPR-associated endonuclease Cas2